MTPYRDGQLTRYRELVRVDESRDLDVPFGCAFLATFVCVAIFVLGARGTVLVPLFGALHFGTVGVLRLMRWHRVHVDLALDGEALVAGETTRARLRLHSRKRMTRVTMMLTEVPPPLPPDTRARRVPPARHVLATVDDVVPGERVVSLVTPADLRESDRYLILIELDDGLREPEFASTFATAVISRDG